MLEDPDQSHYSPNPQIELAKKRNRAAAERTLMAWIRTSLCLISFGFGINSIVSVIAANVPKNIDIVRLSRFLGISFIALGIFSLLIASFQHRRELQRIRLIEPYVYKPETSLGLIVALALIAIGFVAFIGILVNF